MGTLFFEDIQVGHRSSSGPYEVSREEILEFGNRFDPQPFHVDPEAARDSLFGGLVASGCHVFCIRSWLTSHQEDAPALVAGLGLENMQLPNPVRPGDRLRLEVECIGSRVSQKRPDTGVLRMRNTILNQDDAPVMTLVAALLVRRRPEDAARSDTIDANDGGRSRR